MWFGLYLCYGLGILLSIMFGKQKRQWLYISLYVLTVVLPFVVITVLWEKVHLFFGVAVVIGMLMISWIMRHAWLKVQGRKAEGASVLLFYAFCMYVYAYVLFEVLSAGSK